MVQSASIEDGISQLQQPVSDAWEFPLAVVCLTAVSLLQKVPLEEAPPPIQPESPRVPLPPPIIPEAEDSTPSPVSDTSSGYISTSISTATLADVYTLTWDLPPPSSRRSDGFEESLAAEPPPLSAQPSQRGEKTEAGRADADGGPSDPPAQLRTRDGPPRLTQRELGSRSKLAGGAQESLFPQEGEAEQTEKQQSAQAQQLHPPAVDGTEAPPSLRSAAEETPGRDQTSCGPAGDAAATPEDPRVSVPSPASSRVEQVDANAAETEATPEVPASSLTPTQAPTAPPPGVWPAKANPSGSSPFKIQKVKSSDLKSFGPVLGADEAELPGGLAAPLESLEIISDSEGDAAVLPDWLKEGEFVTVGGNKSGTVRFVGPADFAEGTWVGVELEVPAGEQKNRRIA